jgi:hypothetical protein
MVQQATPGRNNTPPSDTKYFQTFFGPQWRPNGVMPVEFHRECGRLLKLVLKATEGRPGAHKAVRYASFTLDDWAMREYTHDELDNDALADLYCPGPEIRFKDRLAHNELIEMLEAVKAILVKHYPRGLALSRMCKELDSAIVSIRKWDGKPRGKRYS